MGSESPATLVDQVNAVNDASAKRSYPCKRSQGKVPKRIHKAEREKLKRDQLNTLFFQLASAIELNQPNSGKALVLCEASRLLKDLFSQIESLKKENAALLSESQYVTVETDELKEENVALEAQIGKLQSELDARGTPAKPDLNIPAAEFNQAGLTGHFQGDCVRMPAVESALPQASAVFVVPICSDMRSYSIPEPAQLASNPTAHVSKPHPRYPTQADLWPSQLLGEEPAAREEVHLSGISGGFRRNGSCCRDGL